MPLHYVWSCFQPYTHWGRLSGCYFVRKQKLCLTQCTGVREKIQMQLLPLISILFGILTAEGHNLLNSLTQNKAEWLEGKKEKSLYLNSIKDNDCSRGTAPHKLSQGCQSLYESWELSLTDFSFQTKPCAKGCICVISLTPYNNPVEYC